MRSARICAALLAAATAFALLGCATESTTNDALPQLLADPKLVVVRCLVKAGLVPPDYTVQKLSAFLEGAVEDMTDFDPTHPEAQKCLTAGGIALLIDRTPGSG
ncbi:hypothetical protein O7626_23155 [Micromonospora sp. WMMD1102]|uniref:hypothetical protein n=1 Tax=Micromonospora sp. WMMD1102 TaxID=3016105 RepID=UPI0024155D01|nr:hypothetical protein [Micromonospora sp. WMMD1102]MDG4788787.1 hypothetical protein [Micromonospora sp. WMMD1102]